MVERLEFDIVEIAADADFSLLNALFPGKRRVGSRSWSGHESLLSALPALVALGWIFAAREGNVYIYAVAAVLTVVMLVLVAVGIRRVRRSSGFVKKGVLEIAGDKIKASIGQSFSELAAGDIRHIEARVAVLNKRRGNMLGLVFVADAYGVELKYQVLLGSPQQRDALARGLMTMQRLYDVEVRLRDFTSFVEKRIKEGYEGHDRR